MTLRERLVHAIESPNDRTTELLREALNALDSATVQLRNLRACGAELERVSHHFNRRREEALAIIAELDNPELEERLRKTLVGS